MCGSVVCCQNLMDQIPPREVHQLFRLGVAWKGIAAVVDIIGSFLVLFTTQKSLVHLVALLTQQESVEDPSDFLSAHLLNAAQSFSTGTKTFAFLYLFIHGVINFVLVIGLLKRKLWAFHFALVVFSLLVLYQLYRFTHTHSLFLIALSVFDVFIIWIIWREYKIVKKSHKS